MPANLTQQYLKAEEEYRRAATSEEELRCLQIMLQEIPKHKGTDHLQADLKSKIAKLKKEIVSEKSGKKTRGFRIPAKGPAWRSFSAAPTPARANSWPASRARPPKWPPIRSPRPCPPRP
jgi:hypothetical protein